MDTPRFRPFRRDLLRQPHVRRFHQDLPALQLAAWKLSNVSSVIPGIPLGFLVASKQHSTIVNYQCKWKRFWDWCKREGHTVSTPSSQTIADFLVFFRQDCHLSSAAIKGYKDMLNSVFAYIGFNLTLFFGRWSRHVLVKFVVTLAEPLRGMWTLFFGT